MANLDFLKISKYNIYVISKGDIYMKHLKQEDVLREIAAGNCTIKGLAAKFGLSPSSMKSALADLDISSKDRKAEPIDRKTEPIIKNDFSASDEDEWKQLYNDYDLEGIIGNQAQYIIAECHIKYGMTAAQARQYMRNNFLSSNNRHNS